MRYRIAPTKTMKRLIQGLIVVGLFVLVSACNEQPQSLPIVATPTLSQSLTQLLTPLPTPTATLLSSATPIPASPTPASSPTPAFVFPDFASLRPGQYLLYTIGDHLVAVSMDGKEIAKQKLPKSFREGTLRVSPDRKKIVNARNYWSVTDPSSDTTTAKELGTITIMDLEQKKIYAIPDPLGCFYAASAAWSPDGTRLATGCGDKIALITFPDLTSALLTTNCKSICSYVQWSPNGKWISFATGDGMTQKNEAGSFMISADCVEQPLKCKETQRGPTNFVTGGLMNRVEWSPDSKYQMYPIGIESRRTFGLASKNIQTLQIEWQISDLSGKDMVWNQGLAWSPDGKWIAFSIQADAIYLIPARGGSVVRFADFPDDWTHIFQWISVPHPFAPGAKYTITPAGNSLNLRDQPSQSGKPLKVLKTGDEITIVKGPTLADGYTWWQMRTQDGVEGWAEDLPDWYQ